MQKFYAALLAALAQAGLVAGDGVVSVLDGIAIATAFVGALAVYRIENKGT